jgi:glycosyltransferase involved in cell wall biosynthesis
MVLKRCVEHAITQSRPPSEVVICDASDEWAANGEVIRDAIHTHPEIRFEYLASPVRSTAWQRNMGIEHCSSDILFLIDDDAFLHPGSAAEVMRIYEEDTQEAIASVSLAADAENAFGSGETAERKAMSFAAEPGFQRHFLRSGLRRWIWRNVLMMGAERLFIAYDTGSPHAGASEFKAIAIEGISYRAYQIGFCTTVRRSVALRERYDNGLLAYSPTEDLDASYRFRKHGLNVAAEAARLFHLEARANRLKRFKVSRLTMTNIAYLVRRNSVRPLRDIPAYYVMFLRRILAEFIKETAQGRFSYPVLRGILAAFVPSVRVMALHPDDLRERYIEMQAQMLGWSTIPEVLRKLHRTTAAK